MKVYLCVITDITVGQKTVYEDFESINPQSYSYIRTLRSAFFIGELIVTNEHFMEIGSPNRFLNDWNIKYQVFDITDYESAIQTVNEVLKIKAKQPSTFEKYFLGLDAPCTHSETTFDKEINATVCKKCSLIGVV